MDEQPKLGGGAVATVALGVGMWGVFVWGVLEGRPCDLDVAGGAWLAAGAAAGAGLHLGAWWSARRGGGSWWLVRRGLDGFGVTLVVAAIAAEFGRSLVEALDGDQAGWLGAGLVIGVELVSHLVPRLRRSGGDEGLARGQA